MNKWTCGVGQITDFFPSLLNNVQPYGLMPGIYGKNGINHWRFHLSSKPHYSGMNVFLFSFFLDIGIILVSFQPRCGILAHLIQEKSLLDFFLLANMGQKFMDGWFRYRHNSHKVYFASASQVLSGLVSIWMNLHSLSGKNSLYGKSVSKHNQKHQALCIASKPNLFP